MFSQELKNLLIKVITSWQVWAVTGVLVLYVFLVNYVSRLHSRKGPVPMPKSGKEKKETAGPAEAPAPSDDDELDLEEKEE
jgi:hypothetical protein